MNINFKKIKSKSILVIGDVMIDTYFLGDVSRVSPEAPIPVLLKKSEKEVLGGAANVAANLTGANQKVSILSFIGTDNAGKKIVSLLEKLDIDTSMMFKFDDIVTTEKTRMLAQNNQQIMRLDQEEILDLTSSQMNIALDSLEQKINEFDLIIISDYLKGVLNDTFTQKVINIANENNVLVIVDVKDPRVEKYKNANILKPNLLELKSLTNMPTDSEELISLAAKNLCEKCKCEYVLTTCGGAGMVLTNNNGEYYKFECASREVFDVSGAGDTVVAYFATGLANGFDIKDAVNLSNIAAGVKVSKIGTAIVYLNEVVKYIKTNEYESRLQKLVEFDQIESLSKQLEGKEIVFTNGCFDIIHSGHVKYLQKAATLGDILIVGLNDDASIARLKGDSRPINKLEDRLEVLSALACIDYILIFGEDTPIELIKSIKPTILAKGADYVRETVVGYDIVEQYGGRVELIELVEGKSTTNIINKMQNGVK